MKNYRLFATVLFVVFAVIAFAKKDNKGIQVQIVHDSQVVLDTVIFEEDEQAREMIESLLMNFSKDSIKVNSEHIHGLYVFHIDNENWKNTNPPANISNDVWAEENFSNTDSLLDELEGELYSNQWNNFSIEIVLDSLADAFDVLGTSISNFDYQESEELVDIKESFQDLFKKVRATRVIITTEED